MFSSTMTFYYISLDKVKPIELNEEGSVDTQIVSNTRLAHFEDTELILDIQKLESLGLSLQEERVPWIFFATFSNQLQQLAKHILHENYIFFL
ncbi:unnamed protein product [Rotaria sp. Silwood1]|nr:unnamed protein product [Rotaria sp. Silwood1]CAF1634040.1 unnamed protein product [Rotaria sp. Silwood1]CAF3730922.1 unnamed protein product [Rotaria sp. Silwood1]